MTRFKKQLMRIENLLSNTNKRFEIDEAAISIILASNGGGLTKESVKSDSGNFIEYGFPFKNHQDNQKLGWILNTLEGADQKQTTFAILQCLIQDAAKLYLNKNQEAV